MLISRSKNQTSAQSPRHWGRRVDRNCNPRRERLNCGSVDDEAMFLLSTFLMVLFPPSAKASPMPFWEVSDNRGQQNFLG